MTSHFSLLTAIGLLFGIASELPAHADPIQVTSGTATARYGGPSGFAFFGADNFALQSFFVSFSMAPWNVCPSRCLPGTTVDLTTVMGGPTANFDLGGGILSSAQVNGVPYGPVSLRGTLSFNVASLIVPPLPDPSIGGLNVTAPFTLTGQATGYATSDVDLLNPLFHIDLVGSGEARFTSLNSAPGGTFILATPERVPEPATIALLATGLGGLMFASRRRCLGVFSCLGGR